MTLARRTAMSLPAWPLYLLFLGYPVWWALGLSAFAVFACSVPMLALLLSTRRVELPPGFLLWAAFLVFSAAASMEVQGGLRLVGFGIRYSQYIGVTILLLYVYNARAHLPVRRVLLCMVGFLAFVIFGGWLGVLIPHGSLSTPVELVLPASIRNNSYVSDLIHPHFAEVQHPYGAATTFDRPSAPFPYTNSWGCNVALLLPLAVATMFFLGRGSWRRWICVLCLAAIVPAAATLNRGMFLALGVALAYAVLRYALRGRVAPIVTVAALAVVALVVADRAGIIASLQERLQYSATTESRASIYQQAWEGTLRSPLFGYGAPRPSPTLDISIGTQGHLWNVMYSYGFPALACFMAFFVGAAWRTRRARSDFSLWLHVVLVVAVLTFFYYGYDGPQLAVLMVAASLAMRPLDTGISRSASTSEAKRSTVAAM